MVSIGKRDINSDIVKYRKRRRLISMGNGWHVLLKFTEHTGKKLLNSLSGRAGHNQAQPPIPKAACHSALSPALARGNVPNLVEN